jgi:cephalosporin-C deacetylase-like acetyl esterase
MSLDNLRNQISQFLRFDQTDEAVSFEKFEVFEEASYRRIRITFSSQEGDLIPAFLLLPRMEGPLAAVLIHHQHNSQRNLGKSEVCGLEGDPLQFFGPELASRGIAVLAPDSICFEDRRKNRKGAQPDEPADMEQHYNEMCYRLLCGDTLMRKVLSDSARGISLLRTHPMIDTQRIGILGHSYGGNTVLFHGALDDRIRFACASGAACTYKHRMTHQIGIEMAEVIPGFVTRFDIPDLVACFAPRHLLLVSATEDKYSQDADRIVAVAHEKCATVGVTLHIEHLRYEGGHALNQERYDSIVNWIAGHAGR